MNVKEIAGILGVAAERCNQSRFLPWWELTEREKDYYKYRIFEEKEKEDVEIFVKTCTRDELVYPAGSLKFTVFHLLVWVNFYDAVKTALERFPDLVNITDANGQKITPVMLACGYGNPEIFKLLAKNGADTSLTDEKNRNCFHHLIGRCTELQMTTLGSDKGHTSRAEIAKLLDCDINLADNEGRTPLVKMLERSWNNDDSCRLTEIFIEKGADTDFTDEDGNTLLMIALENYHRTAALALINAGAEISAKNKNGETPLDIAEMKYLYGLCYVLKEKGAQGAVKTDKFKLEELSQTACNAFVIGEEYDKLAEALCLAKALIKKADPDDDDDVWLIADLFDRALSNDENCTVLDMCREAGFSFTEKFSAQGELFCLRDKCFNRFSSVKAIEKLVAFGVDVSSAIINGETPAFILANLSGGNESFFAEAVKFFSVESMEQLANSGKCALHRAAFNGHNEMLEAMINAGADINITQDEPADRSGDTPLHIACRYSLRDTVALLLRLGADDTLKNIDGETPAHIIVGKNLWKARFEPEKCCAEMMKLLKHIDEQRNDGATPLITLMYRGSAYISEVLPVLLEKGANPNSADSKGNTALIVNTDNDCDKDVCKQLILAGADINKVNACGTSALHYAVRYDKETARFLIKKGADYNIADKDGVTPVQIAVSEGCDDLLELMTDIK